MADCKITTISKKGTKRLVAYIEHSGHSWVNAVSLSQLPKREKLTLLTRFNNWVDGVRNQSHYHGFDKSQYGAKYTKCFQFRADPYRVYGFLENGDRDTRFEFCVLAIICEKHQWNVDESKLKKVKRLCEDDADVADTLEKFKRSNSL